MNISLKEKDKMMKKIVNTNLAVILLVVAGFSAYNMLANAGSLEPATAPAPTMKTLDEIYIAASSSADSFVTSGKEYAADDREFISMSIAEHSGSGFEGIQELNGKSKILKLDQLITVSFDQASGQASGAPVHGLLRVVKTIDKASPGLHKALCTGQNLAEVIFDFYRATSETQKNEVYYTITLRNVRLVEVGPSTDFVTPESYRHMENVSFVYEEIEWKWLPDGGIEETEQW